jgi:soluble lytic murein transglycosylase-like protein
MRKRVMLIAAPLCVVAIAASVAAAAPDTEHPRGARLDELHAERPAAAYSSTAAPITDAGIQPAATQLQDYDIIRFVEAMNRARQAEELAAQQAEAEAAAAEAAAAEARASAAARTVTPARSSGYVTSASNPGDFLSCVRQRESGGNYGIYNQGGSGAAGAYQFMPGTWNSIARSSGRGDLVGVDPAQAAPADQDSMAQALYAQQGAAPWGGGC